MKKSKKIFRTKEGSQIRVPKKRVQKYGEYLERLAIHNGGKLHPQDVVAASKSEDSPLYEYFEWDDSRAGYKWRLEQARYLLRSIEVEIVYKGETKTEKMFFNVKISEKKQAYVPTELIVRNEDYKQQIIQKALNELIYWKEKYKQYKELDRIFGIIEETQQELINNHMKETQGGDAIRNMRLD